MIDLNNLQFLKLGGSLITDKQRPHTLRPETLDRLAGEIADALRRDPELRLVLGHGAGSFGHVPAEKYGTRQGVHTADEWQGFIEVWREEAALNRLVMDSLDRAGLPAMALSPLASVTASGGSVAAWDLAPLRRALAAGLVPVVYGDVVFDERLGGTILSTEDLFAHLARQLRPSRLLLAGLEPGVWADYPACTHLLDDIGPQEYAQIAPVLGGSAAVDVTGGMASKVAQSLALAGELPGLEIYIFSGEIPGAVNGLLSGLPAGTRIHAS